MLGPWRPGPAVSSTFVLRPCYGGRGNPNQPASEEEPEIPGRKEESKEGDGEEEDSLILEGKREKKKVESLTMQVSLQRESVTIV